jgi:hypothetical protein
VPVGVSAALSLVAFAQGGYFPSAWGWSAVGFWWAVVLTLLLRRDEIVPASAALAVLIMVALTAWTGLSVIWSSDVTHSILETERVLAYTGVLAAFVLVPPPGRRQGLVLGVFGCAVAVCLWALGTRLFPDILGFSTLSVGPGRLFAPIGYWNGLGIVAAVALLLALALIDEGRSPAMRLAAAAAAPPMACVLYLTFSRGALAGLAIGSLVWLIIAPRRLRLVLVALVMSPACLLPVFTAAKLNAVTRPDLSLSAATEDGHKLALALIVAIAWSAGVGLALAWAERFAPGPGVRRAFATVLMVIVVVGASAEVARYGSPATQASNAAAAFTSPPPTAIGDPARLTSLSLDNRNALWSVAWREYTSHPAFGSGAGTFEQYWVRDRGQTFTSQWAHGLYIGELAELGPVGLGLVVALTVVVLVGALAARTDSLGVATGACLVALFVHTAVDWDWQLPAVTMLTLALAAYSLLRPSKRNIWLGPAQSRTLIGVGFVALALSAAGLGSNLPIERAQDALNTGHLSDARTDAEQARTLAPWSDQPWSLLGQVSQASGNRADALRDYSQWVRKTPDDWSAWASLAGVSHGGQRTKAVRRACILNPFATLLNRPCSDRLGGPG